MQRLRVDLDEKRFCIEAYCDTPQVSATTLEFHCPDQGGQRCKKMRPASYEGRLVR